MIVRGMRALPPALAVGAVLAWSPVAGAGPPHGVCRHLSASRCAWVLGPYDATQFLKSKVVARLGGHLHTPYSAMAGCGAAKSHRPPWRYRCAVTVSSPEFASPCKVDAVVSRSRAGVWRVDWMRESASCHSG